jgi:hypothetical protein
VPALRNLKHEAFARALAKGLTQIEAYRCAGYPPTENGNLNSTQASACRLAKDASVAQRVMELRAKDADNTQKVAVIDRIWIMSRLLHEALNADNAMARVRCLENLGKMVGVQELSTHTVKHVRNPTEMSTSELRQVLEQARQAGYNEARSERMLSAVPPELDNEDILDAEPIEQPLRD